MSILFVISGTHRVAASRYRVYQYLPYLESQGTRYRVFSTISDFMTVLSIRSPEFNSITRSIYYLLLFIERFFRFWVVFIAAGRYDVLFLQRAIFPFGLARLLPLRNKNIIFDIDDAIFLPDTQDRNPMTTFKAFVKKREVRDSLDISSCVIVENDYIKEYVSKYCQDVFKIQGPIDTTRYFVAPDKYREEKDEIILGWIGSPGTTPYLSILNGVFREILFRFQNVKIVLVGVGNYSFPSDKVIKKKWGYDTEVEELQRFDIGLMPMFDDEWTRGKLGCKMLQYMAVGAASVVSYTPTNAEIVTSGENGFFASSEQEWIDGLSRLIENPKLREEIGLAGRKTVEQKCSVRVNIPKYMEVFKKVYND
ncbi:MAG: glycosyltransferase [Candidatus Omnitrophica bacterium]|nr:glycosyltransferase [Candidatus Omnitrophota bacterium]